MWNDGDILQHAVGKKKQKTPKMLIQYLWNPFFVSHHRFLITPPVSAGGRNILAIFFGIFSTVHINRRCKIHKALCINNNISPPSFCWRLLSCSFPVMSALSLKFGRYDSNHSEFLRLCLTSQARRTFVSLYIIGSNFLSPPIFLFFVFFSLWPIKLLLHWVKRRMRLRANIHKQFHWGD